MGRNPVDICPRCKEAPKHIRESGNRLSYCLDCHNWHKRKSRKRNRKSRAKDPSKLKNFKWEIPGFSFIYSEKKKKSRNKRGLEFTISKPEFQELAQSNCFYCGSPPSNVRKGTVYQGLDRIDSSKGYVPGNVVACCKLCNYGKAEQTQQEFFDHILKIVEHQGLL